MQKQRGYEMNFITKIATACLICTSSSALADVRLPYFGDIDEEELCGRSTRECNPGNSSTYGEFKDLTDFDQAAAWLGRRYEDDIYLAETCGYPLKDDDFVIRGTNDFDASIQEAQSSSWGIFVTGQLDSKVGLGKGILPDGAAAKFRAGLGQSVTNNSSAELELKYYRVLPSLDYRDTAIVPCLNDTPRNQYVILGVSVIEVFGTWQDTVLQEAFAGFEASAEYNELSASVKAAYELKKNEVLTGDFEKVAMVFSYTYQRGRQRS